MLPLIPTIQAHPTQSTFYGSTKDGWCTGKDASNYNIAWSKSSADHVSSSDTSQNLGQYYNLYYLYDYWVHRIYYFFDTSGVPQGAVITNVTLSFRIAAAAPSEDVVVVVQNGQPTYPHDPVGLGDYDKDHYSGMGGNVTVSNGDTGYKNITFSSAGLNWINDEGYTKLCLRVNFDINGEAPSDGTQWWQHISVYLADMGDGYKPILYVWYTFHTVTFKFNEGGIFRVDNATVSNGSSNEYGNGIVIELCAIPQNSSWVFVSFNWTGGSATTNPYDYTVTSNDTVWCYFEDPPAWKTGFVGSGVLEIVTNVVADRFIQIQRLFNLSVYVDLVSDRLIEIYRILDLDLVTSWTANRLVEFYTILPYILLALVIVIPLGVIFARTQKWI